MVKQNEVLTSQVIILQSTSRLLREAFRSTNERLAEVENHQYKLKQYSRRDYFDFSGIPSTAPQTDLEYFGLHLSKEIDGNLGSSQVVACHRLGKPERTIV